MTDNDTGEVEALRAMQNALCRAMIDADIGALEDILADDLAYIHSTAVIEDRAAFLRCVHESYYDYRTIETSNVEIRTAGSLGVTSGDMTMTIVMDRRPLQTMRLLYVLIWKKQEGRWRLTLRQTTSKD